MLQILPILVAKPAASATTQFEALGFSIIRPFALPVTRDWVVSFEDDLPCTVGTVRWIHKIFLARHSAYCLASLNSKRTSGYYGAKAGSRQDTPNRLDRTKGDIRALIPQKYGASAKCLARFATKPWFRGIYWYFESH